MTEIKRICASWEVDVRDEGAQLLEVEAHLEKPESRCPSRKLGQNEQAERRPK